MESNDKENLIRSSKHYLERVVPCICQNAFGFVLIRLTFLLVFQMLEIKLIKYNRYMLHLTTLLIKALYIMYEVSLTSKKEFSYFCVECCGVLCSMYIS